MNRASGYGRAPCLHSEDRAITRRRTRRWLIAAPVTLLLLAVVAAGAVWGAFQASRPQVDGTLTLPGLQGPATVVRDRWGIPTITAGTTADAYFLLGFVHAQDRFLQMETMRRLGAGRLAEVLGERALPTDRWARTLGLYRLATSTLAALDAETLAALDAYAAGVNAWLADDGQWLPPALLALGVTPEPWRPADSLVWQRLMALRLAGNWPDEILRLRLLDAGLPAERVAALWPEGPPGAPVSLPAAVREAALPPPPPAEFTPTTASNAWVLAPERTSTGGAILANDPHLGFEAPILWYLATVQTPEWELSGATVPGVPFHLIGRNASLGWGITTTHADTMDLVAETLADGTDSDYLTPDGPRPFRSRDDVIAVRGGDSVTLTVRETRHGPVVSDLAAFAGAPAGPRQVTALAATALRPEDRTAAALYHLNHARDAAAARQALRLFEAPVQNMVYADADGRIGMVTAGLIPLRSRGDGTLPVAGADLETLWHGFIPFEALPQSESPPGGVLMNANNRVVDDSYPHLIAATWPAPWRAMRAESLLAARDRHDIAGSIAMQIDTRSEMAATLLPLLLATVEPTPATAEARRLLAAWDYRETADRPEPLLFATWMAHIEQALFAEALGDLFPLWRGERDRVLLTALQGDGEWCRAGCGAPLAAALEAAVDDLTARHGSRMADWRWGEAHRAGLVNRLYGSLPVVGALAHRRPPMDGGAHTLLRAGWRGGDSGAQPFEAVHGAGLRAVLDLAAPDNSRFIIATGQSENPLSPHYDDQMPLWLKGELLDLDGEPVSVLRFNHDR